MPPLVRFALLFTLSLAGSGCGRPAGGSSPQDVFDRAKSCSTAGDWAGLYECLAPAKRDAAIGGLLYLAMFTKMGGEAVEAEYKKLMASHGLDPNPPTPDPAAAQGAQLAQWLAPAKDRGRLFSDLMTYTRPTRKADPAIIDPAATLADLAVTGDAASGKLVKPDGKKKPIRFVKQDGAWYLDE